MVKINLEAKEVELIVSIAQKIIIEMDNKDTTILRESEDQHDTTGQPRIGNCECHNG
tara:strand:- start:319 stop:489 length:171 start_codon:yes stop_codon:yes gene_type:complete